MLTIVLDFGLRKNTGPYLQNTKANLKNREKCNNTNTTNGPKTQNTEVMKTDLSPHTS